MSEQHSTWPPPKRKSYGWLIGLGVALFFLAKVVFVFVFVMYSRGLQNRNLDALDKATREFDSVEGDYLEWAGEATGSVYQIKRRLVFDESGRFGTKFIFNDGSGTLNAPADVDFYGQWSETDEVLTLKFQFAPNKWTDLFDSLKNEPHIRFVDNETIELNFNADTVWMSGIPCVKKQE